MSTVAQVAPGVETEPCNGAVTEIAADGALGAP
jgi:hypothetical protein